MCKDWPSISHAARHGDSLCRYTALTIAFAFLLTGCATVAHGTHEIIRVDSEPAGAAVELRCGTLTKNATTPAAIRIPRRSADCLVTITRSGYRTSTTTSVRGIAPAYWLNFIGVSAIFGMADNSPIEIGGDTAAALIVSGGLGLAVDAIDGAMRKHEPSVIHVKLEPDAEER